MMMSTMETKATKTKKAKRPPAQGAAAVTQVLEAFALMPLHMFAEGRNQSIPSLLHDVTGLSKARISQGNLDAVRPSTLRKIDEHQQRLLEARHADPEALASVLKTNATAPRTRSGKHAILAGWMHQLEVLPKIPLPISKAVGLAIDELLEELLAACRDDDLAAFKQILLHHIERHGLAVRVGEKPGADLASTESDLAELRALEDWSQTASFTKRFVDTLYLDMISTLDAEWSSHYFSGRQRGPLFPLVMALPQNELLEGRMPNSRKNLFFRPSRRLLEFLFALLYYIRHKKWPDKPPRPQELANILFRLGEQEVLENSVVSSYFDGSTKLTIDLVYVHWDQMLHHFMPELKEGQWVVPPLPMIILALQWNILLVQVMQDRRKSIFLLDLDKYNLLWRHRRQQWEAHQSKQDKLSSQASHKNGEPIKWPAWMFNQSSSSSSCSS